ncbi:MAG: K(+)-transporting ATPase subunit F [Betaproteobacteria bacterium]|jgi:K+-transporting ATPase KdpF subunit|nr:K(+)-transporting ATPase subunit F [Betaproteobacteria bacterium]
MNALYLIALALVIGLIVYLVRVLFNPEDFS